MNTSQPLHDNDLRIPSQTWGIFLISILGRFLETLFIRWIGTEIRIFAYLQNTIFDMLSLLMAPNPLEQRARLIEQFTK